MLTSQAESKYVASQNTMEISKSKEMVAIEVGKVVAAQNPFAFRAIPQFLLYS